MNFELLISIVTWTSHWFPGTVWWLLLIRGWLWFITSWECHWSWCISWIVSLICLTIVIIVIIIITRRSIFIFVEANFFGCLTINIKFLSFCIIRTIITIRSITILVIFTLTTIGTLIISISTLIGWTITRLLLWIIGSLIAIVLI